MPARPDFDLMHDTTLLELSDAYVRSGNRHWWVGDKPNAINEWGKAARLMEAYRERKGERS